VHISFCSPYAVAEAKDALLVFLFFFFFSLRDEVQLTLSISSRFSFNSLWLKARTKSKPILRV
jgi:hypothetical protein